MISSEPDALIQFHDQPYIAYQEITLTQNFDIYFSGIIRSETAIKMGVLPPPYQQLFEVNKGIQSLTVTFKGNLNGQKYLLLMIKSINI